MAAGFREIDPVGPIDYQDQSDQPRRAGSLAMDGYHYDDALLAKPGRLQRKGAPGTFDVDGLRHMLTRLSRNTEPSIAVSVFDHAIETARAGADLIKSDCRIVVEEGNYLLLNQSPWDGLAAYFEVTVMVETPADILADRLGMGWQELGLSPKRPLPRLR